MTALAHELALEGYIDFGNEDCYMRVGSLQGKIVIRAKADEKVAAALSKELGCTWDLPACTWNTDATGGVLCLWIGPDERRILCDFTEADSLCKRLGALALVHQTTISAVNVSSQFESISLEGHKARDILSAVIPLDIAEESFPDGSVAGTLCAKVRISLMRKAETYHVFARRSEMHYLWRLFENLVRSEISADS